MLTESFVVSTLDPERPKNTTITGIHLHEFQPIPALKTTFKKSSTNRDCLAVGPSHIFAAQVDKAVVHVYNRERCNQEAVVPFPEKIHSIALAGEDSGAGTLILGTEGGRVILWELGTGRQVSTPQHHLQPTTCLAVDPTSNYLLSGSTDSTIHVWSIPGLLSFYAADDGRKELAFAPRRSLLNHRAAITAIVSGHICSIDNIAVSASKDNSCIVWDYIRGDALQTFLLSSSPLCLALDPADRAVYAGYDDGSVQILDFYSQSSLTQALHDPESQPTAVQPPPTSKWPPLEHANAAVLTLDVSYDGTTLLSGHEDGGVHTWDVARGMYGKQLADFAAPITNLHMLTPTGFPNPKQSSLKLHNVVKPRYESFTNGHSNNGTTVPENYTFTAQFMTEIPQTGDDTSFSDALYHPSFPDSLLDETLVDFLASQDPSAKVSDAEDLADLRAQNEALSSQLSSTQERFRRATAEVEKEKQGRWERQQDDEIKAARKKKRRLRNETLAEIARKKVMGEEVGSNEGVEEEIEDESLSSDTDELTDSD